MSFSALSYPEPLTKVIQRFQRLSEPKKRYELLIWFAKRLPVLLDVERTLENKVHGCTSQIYVSARLENLKISRSILQGTQILNSLKDWLHCWWKG